MDHAVPGNEAAGWLEASWDKPRTPAMLIERRWGGIAGVVMCQDTAQKDRLSIRNAQESEVRAPTHGRPNRLQTIP